MKAYLAALWAHLITREKVLFKSATIWLAAIVAAAPDLLTYAQANFPSIVGYVPQGLQAPAMKWIALAIFVARMRSLVKVPAPAPLPAPDPSAARP